MTQPVDRRPTAADRRPDPDDAGVAAATDDDAALAHRFARGDPGAFEAVVDRYQQRIHRLANRLLGWSADAEDVVQEVFLSALKNAARFAGRSSLATWLTAITLNECRSHRRGLLARLRRVARFGSFQPPREAPPADVPAADADAFARVRSAVRLLPPRDREVIVLHYLEEMPVEQVAAMLNLTRGAVDVRLHRARARLRAALGETAEEQP